MTGMMNPVQVETVMPPKDQLGLLIVDLQDSFFKIFEKRITEKILRNSVRIITCFLRRNDPLMIFEHYPQGLGRTNPLILETLKDAYDPIHKTYFSGVRADGFSEKFNAINRHHIVLVGVETQICILQTCYDLLMLGKKVYVPVDAVGSRTKVDWQYGLNIMEKMGATLLTTEMLIFWLLEKAGTEDFKFMLPFLK